MRYSDMKPWVVHEVIMQAAQKEHDRLVSLRLRGLVNQIKCGKLPVSVLDAIERDYPGNWQMIAAARREVLGDS